ncbi:hypothetical protein D3C75_1131440 [compost metagenome]
MKRTFGSGALLEHGIHVRHQEDFRLAGTFEGRDDMAAFVRGIGYSLNGRAELFQLFDGDVADLGQAGFIAGTGVDIHQPFQQLQGFPLVLLGVGQDLCMRLGEYAGGEGTEGQGQAGGQQRTRQF